MKITIIGSSGGGKSTLARKISHKFGVPRFEIDRIWFKHGGHERMNAPAEEKSLVQEKIQREVEDFIGANGGWVFDGTYSKIQPIIADRADIVVLIRRPLANRILSHIVRIIRGVDRHPEVTRMQDLRFTKIIIKRWMKGENKNLSKFVESYKHKLVVLKSFAEVDRFFQSLSK